jgi:hypothetical protein
MNYLRRMIGSTRMTDVLVMLGFLAVWMVLQYVVLPRLGVPT